MKKYQAELLYDAKCALGEGPVFDEARNGLYWLDITDNRIYFLDFASGQCVYTQLDRQIGSIVPTDRGRFLAGMDNGVYLIDGLQYTPYCLMPESEPAYARFNDGKCDPAGRFIVGTQAAPNEAGLAHLFTVDAKDSYRIITGGIGCSNGLAWTQDGKTMYYVDTTSKTPSRICAFDYDVETGEATNRRDIIDFSKEAAKGILADGMTIDRDGNLWIAEWGGYGVGCWDPKTGEKIAWVDVPTERVSCCTFGGKDYATLYITTADGNGEHSGGVFAVKMDTSGFPACKFRE